METFDELKRHIFDEIKDAHEYIREAMEHKKSNPQRANTYRVLAEAELEHMQQLHDEFVREIKEWKEKNGKEPSPDMQARYDTIHEIATEQANEVRAKIQLFKQA